MTTYDEARRGILADLHRASTKLMMVDSYLRIPGVVLHGSEGRVMFEGREWIKPLLKRFDQDKLALLDLAQEARDLAQDAGSNEDYVALHKLYRQLLNRYTQDGRRARMQRAEKKAVELHGSAPPIVRKQWALDLSKAWGVRRLSHLEDARRALAVPALTTDERAEALLEFWSKIDREIEEGKLPPWPNLSVGATPRSTRSRTAPGGTTSSE
jgi:hypothetical protein